MFTIVIFVFQRQGGIYLAGILFTRHLKEKENTKHKLLLCRICLHAARCNGNICIKYLGVV